ncbi:MAG TPA: 2OG-Fe dioxygenase family protein [Chthonomonadaceae bacterium]|nr:2OG-Fe dioxygenase family protein [Chthonomonadaceae bacterium]
MEPITIGKEVRNEIVNRGFAWIPQAAWTLSPEIEPHWRRLQQDWDHLEPDRYLKPGATFRQRRYGRFYWSPVSAALLPLPHAPYFQPEAENAYAGGVDRTFAPLLPETECNPFLHALVRCTFAHLPVAEERRQQVWEVRVHQIRIVATSAEPGQPAPEGIHQDGTDFLTLHLVHRDNIVGGESTIYDLDRRPLYHVTLREPMDSFLLEDPRVLHGVTPVYPADSHHRGIRDLFGIDFIFRPDLQRPGSSQ